MLLLKKIPPANLKGTLSFLHNRHVRRLEQYLNLMARNCFEQETCWRVLKELNRGSALATVMRQSWAPIRTDIQVNTEILKTLLKSIRDESLLYA